MKKPDCAWMLADLKNVPQNGIKVMSTFACGGGSSMGYKRAGCSIVAANDIKVPLLKLVQKHRWISAGEATADLQNLTDAENIDTKASALETKYWKLTSPGNSLSEGVEKLTGKRSWFNCYRIPKEDPSGTLTASHNCFSHYSEPRHLTFREYKRLGSFPDDYEAKTDKIGKYMIGMSVPPKMTEVVARAVIDQWLQPNP